MPINQTVEMHSKRLGLVGLASLSNAGPFTRSLVSGFAEWDCESLLV